MFPITVLYDMAVRIKIQLTTFHTVKLHSTTLKRITFIKQPKAYKSYDTVINQIFIMPTIWQVLGIKQ